MTTGANNSIFSSRYKTNRKFIARFACIMYSINYYVHKSKLKLNFHYKN